MRRNVLKNSTGDIFITLIVFCMFQCGRQAYPGIHCFIQLCKHPPVDPWLVAGKLRSKFNAIHAKKAALKDILPSDILTVNPPQS